MKKSLIAALALACLPVAAVYAQGQQEQQQTPQDRRAAAMEQFNERFTAADVDGDGRLTREEAAAKMPGVASHFDELDVDHKGYLTKRDIAMGMRKMAQERKANGGQMAPQQ